MGWAKISELETDAGFGRHDRDTIERLAASLRRFGQVRPILVCGDSSLAPFRVVDGRCIIDALKLNGKEEVWFEHVGDLSDEDQAALNLALRIQSPLAHISFAQRIVSHLEGGRLTAESLAGVTPFTVHQVKGLPGLVRFDSSRFAQETGQADLDYAAEAVAEAAEEVQPQEAVPPPAEPPPAQAAEDQPGDDSGGGLPF